LQLERQSHGLTFPNGRFVGTVRKSSACFIAVKTPQIRQQMKKSVSGHSKPARKGQMKTGHFESGIAHKTAMPLRQSEYEGAQFPNCHHRKEHATNQD
jgi:hypothetical protein